MAEESHRGRDRSIQFMQELQGVLGEIVDGLGDPTLAAAFREAGPIFQKAQEELNNPANSDALERSKGGAIGDLEFGNWGQALAELRDSGALEAWNSQERKEGRLPDSFFLPARTPMSKGDASLRLMLEEMFLPRETPMGELSLERVITEIVDEDEFGEADSMPESLIATNKNGQNFLGKLIEIKEARDFEELFYLWAQIDSTVATEITKDTPVDPILRAATKGYLVGLDNEDQQRWTEGNPETLLNNSIRDLGNEL